MGNFAVHLFTQVRVKITGIAADNMAQAMESAEASVDLHELLDNSNPRGGLAAGASPQVRVEHVEWAEGGPDNYLVDTLLETGEVDYDKTGWFGPDGLPLVDGKNTVERKAARADQSVAFMQELLGSAETLTGIAEEHGARTLADLMYLQQAILKGSFIDHYPDESKVLEIAQSLPTGEVWASFIKPVTPAENSEEEFATR